MHRGMEILMSRMDSHPEEFDITFQHLSASRWRFVLKPLIDRCEAEALLQLLHCPSVPIFLSQSTRECFGAQFSTSLAFSIEIEIRSDS